MANKKLTELTFATPDDTDLIYLVKDPSGTPLDRKTTVADVVATGITLADVYPVGSVYMSIVSTNPATLFGIGTWARIAEGRMLVSLDSGDPDFDNPEETGGTKAVTPAGTNSAPTFTGAALATHTHTEGTFAAAAQTISGSVASESAHTHSVTAAGTNATSTVTPTGTLAWPVGVPTAATESAHTHSGTTLTAGAQAFTGSSAAITGTSAAEAAHTHSVTSNVTVADHAAHTHSVTAAGTNSAPAFTGNAVAAASTTGSPDLVTALTTGAGVSPVTTATGTVAAPTFTGSGVTSGNPSATLTHTPTNNAVTSGAGSSHSHGAGTFVVTATGTNATSSITGNTGAGSAHTHTLSWPAGVPTFAGDSNTVAAQTFTGSPVTSGAGSAHVHTVGTLANSTSAVTGTSGATSAGTPAGTVSAPSFSGTSQTNLPPYFVVYMWKRTA